MAVSKVDAANQIENQLPQANIAGNVNFRNIIINGDMSIAQRGTSATGIGNGDNGYHTCDRWRFFENGSLTAEFTQSQSTDVPTGQGFAKSLKMDCTTAQASLDAANAIYLMHRLEGQNLQYLKKGTSNAISLTLSFWVKSNKTGTYIAQIYDNDNGRHIAKSYTINSSNTWEKKTITYAGDTTGTLDNDNANSLEVYFSLALGSNYTSGTLATSWESYTDANWGVGQTVNLADSTDNEWYVTGVQLEAGEVASDFEFLPHDVNLRRCQRYFFKSYNQGTAIGTSTTANAYFQRHGGSGVTNRPICIEYATEMRAVPSITSYSLVGTSGAISDCGTGFSHSADRTVSGYAAVGTKRMGGYSVTSGFDAVQASHIVAEAEL